MKVVSLNSLIFIDIRRPDKVSESVADFVARDCMGSKIDIDIKRIEGSGRRPININMQTQDKIWKILPQSN